MRLKRLDLTRYGKFTDHSIDFGWHREGESDLHVVYGPNEAGKSTALAGFLDLLFGIETRSRFNFLHPYPTMRVGASLELFTGNQDLLRVKRPQNSLLDTSERPISEGVILGELGGIDRESYRTMFSLDDETLEAGGESILASKGDLGQLLFSASAGLANLSQHLTDLRGEADKFYKYRARGGELAELKTRLAALKDERECIDTLASQHAQLVENCERTGFQYEKAIANRAGIQARLDEIQRFLNVLPRLTELRAIRERLVPLENLPVSPLGWSEELPKLQSDEIELAVRAEGLEDEITQLVSALDTIVVDETALKLAFKAGRLVDLRARYLTAEKDIPERLLQAKEAEVVISGILSRIGRKGEVDPARLVLVSSVLGSLRALMEARSGIDAARKSAENELAEAQRRFGEAQGKLKAAGSGQEAQRDGETQMASFAATVAALRADDHAARRHLALRSRTARLETLADRLRALKPWQGDVLQLADIVVPDHGTIEEWKTAELDIRKEVEQRGSEVERLIAERLRLRAELDALGSAGGVVSDQEASNIRSAREQAWANHRRTLDAASADNFEAALRHDDIVMSARFAHTAELARLSQKSQTLAVVEADFCHAQALRDQTQSALHHFHEKIASVIRAIAPGLADGPSLTQIESWLRSRTEALEAWSLVRNAERDLREAEADADAARAKLAAAFVAAGIAYDVDVSFETLLIDAQMAIDHESEMKALRDAVEDRRRDLEHRERGAERVIADDRTWASSWAEACSNCWLGESGSAPSLAEVREILAAIADLGSTVEKKTSLADRIAKMERDKAEFSAEVVTLAQELNVPLTSGAVLDLAAAIEDRVQRAKAAWSGRAEKEEDLKRTKEKQCALFETIAIHEKRKTEVMAFFGAGSLAEVGVALQRIETKADLKKRAELAAGDILNAVCLPTLDQAEQALDAADRIALEAELVELKARFEDQDQRSRDLFSALSKALDRIEAIGGDDAVARIEERRRTILLEIEEGALRYLKLCAGIAAAGQALWVYRDRHRSSMMAHASEAFRTISRGAYKGLAAQPGKESEILVAISAEGGSKVASELSKGTRFQLYLALRVAGYHEFALSRRPVPFIADDIMETFDDFRAEEAIRLFADMANVGQVIYFTHHQHICEIARRICPGTKIHQLT